MVVFAEGADEPLLPVALLLVAAAPALAVPGAWALLTPLPGVGPAMADEAPSAGEAVCVLNDKMKTSAAAVPTIARMTRRMGSLSELGSELERLLVDVPPADAR